MAEFAAGARGLLRATKEDADLGAVRRWCRPKSGVPSDKPPGIIAELFSPVSAATSPGFSGIRDAVTRVHDTETARTAESSTAIVAAPDFRADPLVQTLPEGRTEIDPFEREVSGEERSTQ